MGASAEVLKIQSMAARFNNIRKQWEAKELVEHNHLRAAGCLLLVGSDRQAEGFQPWKERDSRSVLFLGQRLQEREAGSQLLNPEDKLTAWPVGSLPANTAVLPWGQEQREKRGEVK